jgi:hypothetical protein
MASDDKKTPLMKWYYRLGIIGLCVLIFEKGSILVNYLLKIGVLTYQNSKVMIMPLIALNEQFRWTVGFLALISLFVMVWVIYRSFFKGEDGGYKMILIILVVLSLCGLGFSLYALSKPLPILGLVMVLVIPVALSLYLSYITIHTIWLTLLDHK